MRDGNAFVTRSIWHWLRVRGHSHIRLTEEQFTMARDLIEAAL